MARPAVVLAGVCHVDFQRQLKIQYLNFIISSTWLGAIAIQQSLGSIRGSGDQSLNRQQGAPLQSASVGVLFSGRLLLRGARGRGAKLSEHGLGLLINPLDKSLGSRAKVFLMFIIAPTVELFLPLGMSHCQKAHRSRCGFSGAVQECFQEPDAMVVVGKYVFLLIAV